MPTFFSPRRNVREKRFPKAKMCPWGDGAGGEEVPQGKSEPEEGMGLRKRCSP